MRRVLVVLEDYNEALFVETILKKVGFDVQSIPSEASLADQLMRFLPDLVIATGEGSRVDGKSVSKKVKRKGFQAKLILVFPRATIAQKDSLKEYSAQGAIETPINPRHLIRAVCEFTGLTVEPVLAKFDKLPINQEPLKENIQIVSGGKAAPPPSQVVSGHSHKPHAKIVSAKKITKENKYAKFVQGVPAAPEEAFNHRAVERERKRQGDIPDSPEEIKSDGLRKEFVEKLFKTWKK